MKPAGTLLLAWSLLACAQSASAETAAPVAAGATPLGSPGNWVGTGDYPAAALRFAMAGVTAFKLAVDATGKPIGCDIAQSSGFDVLDTATCQRVMANARFSPARDQAGNPAEGFYSGRVRWVLPPGSNRPVSERSASMLLSIDQTGKVISCRIKVHIAGVSPAPAENQCTQALSSPLLSFGLELRGNFQGALAEVELRMADVFTPALRASLLAPVPGYEQRGLNIHHFTITHDGKIGQCNYEQQHGSDHLITDFCAAAQRDTYDPPFAAFSEEGTASGWHIARVLLKKASQ